MNKSSFNISLDCAVTVLKKMKFLKDQKKYNNGIYSQDSIDSIKSGDLKEIYTTAINNKDYELLLDDDSIFQFGQYEGKLRYAFLQSQLEYFSFNDFLLENFSPSDIPLDEKNLEEIKMIYNDEYEQRRDEQKINTGAMYIRYDLDKNGYKPNLHSYSHIHIGLNNSLRLPSSIVLTPLAFVLFVIKHVYLTRWEFAIKDQIINNEIFKFKDLCEKIEDDFWKEEEKRDLYII